MKTQTLACVALVLSCLFAFPGTGWSQQRMRTVEVGMYSTTHITFTSDLTYVDVPSPETISAKVVKASKNILALMARKEFPYVTTITALESNGMMHTFYVRYNSTPEELLVDFRVADSGPQAQVNTQVRPSQQQGQQQPSYAQGGSAQSTGNGSSETVVVRRSGGSNSSAGSISSRGSGLNVTSSETSNFGRNNAPTLEEVNRMPRELFHITDKSYGLEASIENIYAYSDLTYIVISIKNRSDIGFDAGDAQFNVESRKITGKTLVSDKPVWPKSSYGTLACRPNQETKIAYTIPKLTLQKNEVLKVYVYERKGNRNLVLTLDDKDVNYAVSPHGKQ